MASFITSPYPVFFDTDGTPLENGFIYIGTANQNPVTSPIDVFWDEALTQPAAQPIRTLNGYAARNGTPSKLYTAPDNFSMLVRNRKESQVYYTQDATTGPNFLGYPITSSQISTLPSTQISFLQTGPGAVTRTAESKMRDSVSVKDFGAKGDGSTSDNLAFNAMASAFEYIVVPTGDFLLTTIYIDVPIFFTEGGAVKVNSGNTITFRNRISSSKQQIFKGDGDIRFALNGSLGEDSKHAYAAWWGIFPVNQANTIQTVAFNKALAAYTSLPLREGTFEMDIGSYRIDGKITIPRGVHFKGAGTRLTIFDLIGDNYNAIETGESACRITGIQFERPIGSAGYFNGTQIKLIGPGTHVVDDVRVQGPKIGIEVTENVTNARLSNIGGFYEAEPAGGYPADSAMIWVKGDGCQIDTVSLLSTAYGPASMILAGYNSTAGIASLSISNVLYAEKSRGVRIWANTFNVLNVNINGVTYYGEAAGIVDSAIDITTEGTSAVSNVLIEGVVSNNSVNNLLTINQGSSAYCENITFASGSANSSSVKAATLTRTLGTIRNIVIGDDVNANLNATPVEQIGDATYFKNVYISPRLTPGVRQPSYSWLFGNFPDNTANYVNIGDNLIFTGILAVSIGSTKFGMWVVRAATSPAITPMIVAADNVATAPPGTVLTGTTGVDGNFTVSVTSNGRIYFENRLGTSQTINLTLMTGSFS